MCFLGQYVTPVKRRSGLLNISATASPYCTGDDNLASSWMIPNKLKTQNKNLINILTKTKIQKAHKLKIKLNNDLIPSGIQAP